MKQHVVHDQVAVRYADGVDDVWDAWEPSLRHSERMLGGHASHATIDDDELALQLRRCQYRAHTAAEFAAGLVPPPSAFDAHAFLLGTLASCRDTLGVLALRAEMSELDDDIAEIGLHAVDLTRDAFRGARSTTALVHAWVAEDRVDPQWLHEAEVSPGTWPFVLWLVIGSCAALLIVLVVEALMAGVHL